MKVIDDRYHVLECVDRREHSEIYRVEDRLRPGRLLAMKRLRGTDDEARRNLANDFRVRSGLRHQGVPRVFELGVDPESNSPYYTGEWIEGRGWDEVTDGAEPSLLYRLCADVCSTLDHCHARGLLHLDLKPKNLLVVSDDGQLRVKVLDFGLARGRTRWDLSGGTPTFMAPELLHQKPFDGRADLYSLGITLLPPDQRPDVPGQPDIRAMKDRWPELLVTLVRRLVERNPDRRFPSARSVLGYLERTGAVPPAQIRQLLDTETPFVGRGVAMSRLREAFRRFFGPDAGPWEEPPGGRSGSEDPVSCVMVVGEPGIGKTRLMREFRALVATLPPVVVGGDPYREEVPFPPLGDPLARLWQRREIREGVGKPYGKALQVLLPGLTPPPDSAGVEPGGQRELVRTVVDFLAEAGKLRPGTLFLDDVDRGNRGGQLVLRELLQREDNPWFVVATAREAVELPATEVIQLSGIDERAIEKVLEASYGEDAPEPQLVSRVHRVTGGNPSFLEQLLRRLRPGAGAWAGQGLILPELEELETPADLAESIQGRQRGLSAELRGPLGFLAVARRPLPLDAMCLALDARESEMSVLLEALVELGLVHRDGAGPQARYSFGAEHHAAATAAALKPAQRRAHHEAMTRLLAHAEDVTDLLELARHLVPSGDLLRAAVVLLRAGRLAATRFNHESAEAILRRALSHTPSEAAMLRAEIGLALGDLLVTQGRYKAAADAFEEVEGLDPQAVGPETKGRLALHHGALLLKMGERGPALALLHRAIGFLEGTADHGVLASAYGELASAFMAEDRQRARQYADLALAHITEDSPPKDSASLHLISGQLAALSGDYRVGLEDVGRAAEIFREAGAARQELAALHALGSMQLDLGRLQEARTFTQRAVERAEAIGDQDQLATLAVGHGDSFFLAGEYDQALHWYRRGLDQARDIGHRSQEALARMHIGRLLSSIGDPDGAQVELEQAVFIADAMEDKLVAGEARVWLTAMRLRTGDGDGLLALLDRAEEDLEPVRLPRALQSASLMRAAVHLRQGQHDDARRGLNSLLDERPLAEIACTLLRLLARLERLGDGRDLPAAYARAREALTLAERIENPDARWRSLVELGKTCLDQEDREQAGEILNQLQELQEWIEQRLPEDRRGTHRIHRAVGRLARELGVATLPTEEPGEQEPLTGPARAASKAFARLDGILDTMRTLMSERTSEQNLAALLEAAVSLSGAERGLLRVRVRGGEGDSKPTELYFPSGAFSTSNRLLEEVLRTGQAAWTANATADPRFADRDSVLVNQLRSILCAPMRQGDRIEGVMYVDHPFKDAAFGPRELALVEALACSAAMVSTAAHLAGERGRLRQQLADLNAELEAGKQAMAASPTLPVVLTGAAQPGAAQPAPVAGAVAVQRGQLKNNYGGIIGQHPALVLALQTIDHVVDTEIPVYLHGESGTGKELFARALHGNGPRKDNPFMALNCAAIPEQLLESELFGHVRGAFTGATADRKGLFEMADEGTLFLDEVGDMSAAMQSKLLRVLQEGEIRRVGGTRTKKVDVRVVAASHRDLAAMVTEETFRQDVYYRLCAITVTIPPLRQRREDVPLLLEAFLAEEASERGTMQPVLDPEIIGLLVGQDWPGNVRQLRNVVRTMWALAGGRTIGRNEVALALGQPSAALPSAALPGAAPPAAAPPAAAQPAWAYPPPPGAAPPAAAPPPPAPPPIPPAAPSTPPVGPSPDSSFGYPAPLGLEERERQAILAALHQAGGNKVQAAKILGISRRTLYRKIDRYGI